METGIQHESVHAMLRPYLEKPGTTLPEGASNFREMGGGYNQGNESLHTLLPTSVAASNNGDQVNQHMHRYAILQQLSHLN